MISKGAITSAVLAIFMALSAPLNAQEEYRPSEASERGGPKVTLSTPPILVDYEDQALCIAANVGEQDLDVQIDVIDLIRGEVADNSTADEPHPGSDLVTLEPNGYRALHAISPGVWVYLCKFTVAKRDRRALRASICGRATSEPIETSSTCKSALSAE